MMIPTSIRIERTSDWWPSGRRPWASSASTPSG
jgi:hypothetical protein